MGLIHLASFPMGAGPRPFFMSVGALHTFLRENEGVGRLRVSKEALDKALPVAIHVNVRIVYGEFRMWPVSVVVSVFLLLRHFNHLKSSFLNNVDNTL